MKDNTKYVCSSIISAIFTNTCISPLTRIKVLLDYIMSLRKQLFNKFNFESLTHIVAIHFGRSSSILLSNKTNFQNVNMRDREGKTFCIFKSGHNKSCILCHFNSNGGYR